MKNENWNLKECKYRKQNLETSIKELTIYACHDLKKITEII